MADIYDVHDIVEIDKKGMTQSLFRATIEDFEVIPKIRLPLTMKWSKAGKRYLSMKANLAYELRRHFGFNRDKLDVLLSLSCAIHYKDRRKRDVDNSVGAIMDALQYADPSKGLEAIIENDHQIRELKKCNIFYDGKARLVIELRIYGGALG